MPKKRDRELREQIATYRSCFSTASGRVVLSQLLAEAGLFDDNLKTIEELAVENFAKKWILKNLGILEKSEDIPEYVDKLFELRSS